jgi:probable rRNA maturation factor
MALKITIADPHRIVIDERRRIRALALTVFAGEGIAAANVNIALVDNPTIHRLNKQFLDHDEATDVLTFPLSAPDVQALEGEVVVGFEVARKVARKRGHDEQAEVALYIIHGLLHLCGYDDATRPARRKMRDRERHYLGLLGLPDIAEVDA